MEEWPKKSAGEVAAHARESVNRLQRKAFSAGMTRAQEKISQASAPQKDLKNESEEKSKAADPALLAGRPPRRWKIKNLLEVRNYSSLSKLVRIIAWIWRAAKKWIEMKSQSRTQEAKHKVSLKEKAKQTVLTVREREDALRDLFGEAQEGVAFPDTTLSRLAVYRDVDSELLVCGGRIQLFDEDKTAVPVLPCEAWVSTLLAQEAHKANHEGIAGTLLRMRKKVWVIKDRRIEKQVVDSCVVCRKNRAKQCQQIMSDLPPE